MDPKDYVSKTAQPIPPRELALLSLRTMEAMQVLGGKGSGNFGHAGRPGEVGGSGEGGGDDSKAKTDALESLRNEIQRSGPRYGGPDIDEIRQESWGPVLGVRYFGTWENPSDMDEDEDDSDYDWQVPTKETAKKFTEIAEKFSKQYGVKITWSAGEKNYVYFEAESAKKGRSAGGKGSGNFGHAGRPGEVGGSAPSDGGSDHDAQIAKPSSEYPPARADGLDTQERFKVGRQYTPERQALHRAIIAKTLQGKSPVKNPTAVVLGGGPASGKSSLEKAEHLSEGNVVLVNPDAIKEMLPEFQEGKGNKQVSSLVHEESSDISKQLTEEAAKGSYNIVLDGTGDSSVEKLGGKIAVMRSGGHEVVGKYVTLPTDMAVRLAKERGDKMAAEGKVARYVPETYLREAHAAVSNTFAEALKQGLFDRADLYDTTEFGNMRKVVSAKGKDITIHDQALWDTFLAKGKKS